MADGDGKSLFRKSDVEFRAFGMDGRTAVTLRNEDGSALREGYLEAVLHGSKPEILEFVCSEDDGKGLFRFSMPASDVDTAKKCKKL